MTTHLENLGTITMVERGSLKQANRVRHTLGHAWKKGARGKSPDELIDQTTQRTHHWAMTNDTWITSLMSSEDVTRVALAGDWHTSPIAAASAFETASNAGAHVIAHVGDLGVWPGAHGRDYLGLLELLTLHYDLPLLFVDGNHEDFTQLEAAFNHATGVGVLRPRVLHLHRGTVWTWGGHRFAALGGATSIDKHKLKPGRSWWPQEAITERDVQRLLDNAGGQGADVLLTHDTVSLAPLPTDPLPLPQHIQLECTISRQHVSHTAKHLRPKLHVHGHYHEHLEYRVGGTHTLSLNEELDEGSLALLTLKPK